MYKVSRLRSADWEVLWDSMSSHTLVNPLYWLMRAYAYDVPAVLVKGEVDLPDCLLITGVISVSADEIALA